MTQADEPSALQRWIEEHRPKDSPTRPVDDRTWPALRAWAIRIRAWEKDPEPNPPNEFFGNIFLPHAKAADELTELGFAHPTIAKQIDDKVMLCNEYVKRLKLIPDDLVASDDLAQSMGLLLERIDKAVEVVGRSAKPAVEEVEIDDVVTLQQAAGLSGLSKRTLERHVAAGKLPTANIKGGGGKANRWFWKDLKPRLEKVCDRRLPAKFPGSRIRGTN